MAVKATASKRDIKRRIFIIVLLAGLAVWTAYDGFFSPGTEVAQVGRMSEDGKWARVTLAEGNDDGFETGERIRVVTPTGEVKFEQTIDEIRIEMADGEPNPTAIDKAMSGEETYLIELKPPAEAGDKIYAVNWHVTLNQAVAIVAGLGALYQLIGTIRFSKFEMAADEQGLAIGGRTIPWDRVVSLDMSRYGSKGIAVLNYTDDSGKPRKYNIDNLLLDNVDPLLDEIQRHVQTTGLDGPTGGEELEREESSAEAASEPTPQGEESDSGGESDRETR